MGFLDRPQTKSSNPASKFLEWKSDNQEFAYYDKTAKQQVAVNLPITFLVLEEYHTVKGWSDKDQTGIYSNEVLNASEEIEVKTFKGRVIAKGSYKDIKSVVNAAGGKYHKSIYAVTSEGELVNLTFKGASVSKWSDFTAKGAFKRLKDEWVTIADAEQMQKGKIKYAVPNFAFNKSLSDADVKMIMPLAEEFSEYMTAYSSKQLAETVKDEPVDDTDGDDLDF